MASPSLLSIAKADLTTAIRNINDPNKFIKHQCAYFTQQSIEKTIKYLISLKNGGTFPWGHNIGLLVHEAQLLGINIPDIIKQKANSISTWESGTRYYPTQIIRRDTIERIIRVTQDWHKDLAKQGIK